LYLHLNNYRGVQGCYNHHYLGGEAVWFFVTHIISLALRHLKEIENPQRKWYNGWWSCWHIISWYTLHKWPVDKIGDICNHGRCCINKDITTTMIQYHLIFVGWSLN